MYVPINCGLEATDANVAGNTEKMAPEANPKKAVRTIKLASVCALDQLKSRMVLQNPVRVGVFIQPSLSANASQERRLKSDAMNRYVGVDVS